MKKRNGTQAVRRGRTVRVVCAVAVTAAMASACGDDGDGGGGGGAATTVSAAPPSSPTASPSGTQTSPSPGGTAGMTNDQAERKALVPAAKVGYDQAAKSATDKVPGSKLVDIDLKRSAGGAPEWHVKVAVADGTESDVVVDAVSGGLTSSSPEADQDAEDKRETADRLNKAKVSWQDAASTALGRKKGTITSLGLDDMDDGSLVWSVDVVTTDDWNKTTYDVDAVDGSVKREHVDRD
ncbi:PepSY domain-containing protein [Streptomyces aureoversilis]|uniref:PepSY domain-containing protein n=1 Tax=Streptomyces aureoversilis TaxID=67277 RepID=A0ABV9ZWH9_9ACTN